MSTLDEIKAAAASLAPEDQFELFRWWIESDAFRQRQLDALRFEILGGIDDLEDGRYQTYTDANLMQLAEEVGRSGRERLLKDSKQEGA